MGSFNWIIEENEKNLEKKNKFENWTDEQYLDEYHNMIRYFYDNRYETFYKKAIDLYRQNRLPMIKQIDLKNKLEYCSLEVRDFIVEQAKNLSKFKTQSEKFKESVNDATEWTINYIKVSNPDDKYDYFLDRDNKCTGKLWQWKNDLKKAALDHVPAEERSK